MKTTKSKYKFWGGFSLILFLCFAVSLIASILFVELIETHSTSIVLSIVLLLAGYVLALLFLLGQIKRIKIDKNHIIATTPVFMFFRKSIMRKEGDYYVTVDEYSRGGSYEAVWIIRNEKVIQRFSSFYYSNYDELKRNIRIEYKGAVDVGALTQVFYILGGKFSK